MREIRSVAVLGSGTMGLGIAALCANRGIPVLLLDVASEGGNRNAVAEKALERMQSIRPPALDDPENVRHIKTGNFDDDLARISECDWVCEAIVEDLAVKRAFFQKLEPLRRDGSIVTTNTSGIPLRAICEGMGERFRRDIAVTHFFNPVNIMKLLELVPGEDTDPEVMSALSQFCGGLLGKGVVYAKDTVNFIGNRIGCFWMLSGLHMARAARINDGLTAETVDALMSAPVGLPGTGLYGLIDLIGLDVMDFVGKNLDVNLPAGDAGRAYTVFPPEEAAMLARGQLGRKTGGGFYKLVKHSDGSKSKETFDLGAQEWRAAEEISLNAIHTDLGSLVFAQDAEGRFAWDLMVGTLCYAADLVPEISDDIVNIDRAMRWGFAWSKGPFEMLDAIGPLRVVERLEREGRPVPAMLSVLRAAGKGHFYVDDGARYLGRDGAYHAVP
ncbi:MAG: 3-hydroxyacyl-CoA dehydrogenase family protein [Rhodospirillales bacterium]|nr:3-hydroxyacyl-CoA dehydrogenase family protein [Rhodospirillales bacterium]MCW9002640.1 3-hydroxyacyl-CoA dehydrogenase family protein [Rhodospirillales bacterium]